ncbi:hypothetical protein ACFL3X_00855 [Gemmatimonadota bacterium]
MKQSKLSPRQMARWESTRTKGKRRFVLLNALVVLIAYPVGGILGGAGIKLITGSQVTISVHLTGLMFMAPTGILIGIFLWGYYESKFQKTLASQSEDRQPTDSEQLTASPP